ncbi:MAG TPA: hypothetical protein VFM05_10490, partial [Candidatus Saccharimonadales bacterium]|nr:hypothetical protein [Candidatus Saccharimonadales bacterium]
MFNPKTKKQTLVTRLLLPVLSAVILIVSFVTYFERPNRAEAATSSSINFQARLLTAAGQVVPDGNYNVEFKLYYASAPDAGETPDQGACTVNSNAASDEDCVWVETRTGGNRVRTVNGYLTVNLGSVTAFGSSINWDQDIWLTMNVGGGGVTASWDGEMT